MSSEGNRGGGRLRGAVAVAVGFLGNVARLVHADIVKLFRYWVIIAGYAVMFVIPLLGAVLVYYAEQKVRIISISGYAFAVAGFTRCVDLAQPILYVMICTLFALEVSHSTIKYILARPITRMELLVSKYVTAFLMVVLALLIFWAVSLGTGWYFFGLGDLMDDTQNICFTAWETARGLALGTLLVLVPMFTVAAMALMISSYSSTMGGAIIIGLIAYVFFQLLSLIAPILPDAWRLTFESGGESYVFPFIAFAFPSLALRPIDRLDSLVCCFQPQWWDWEIQSMLIVCAAYFIIFFAVSAIGVKRRDFIL